MNELGWNIRLEIQSISENFIVPKAKIISVEQVRWLLKLNLKFNQTTNLGGVMYDETVNWHPASSKHCNWAF